jgi:glutamine synthetase adenylyltransferase
MQALPKWLIATKFPAIHDFESLSVIEQTARVYGAMQELIKEHNAFCEAMSKEIADFKEAEQKKREEFETNMTKVLRQFMCSMEQKAAAEGSES